MADLTARPAVSSLASVAWDVIVVGGGITGAAVLREVQRAGLRGVLLERDDFASGTSSRSSKLVHGGLHYLARLEIGLARKAVRDRERLLSCGYRLVEPLEFLILTHSDNPVGRWRARLGIAAYRLVAGRAPGRIRLRGEQVAAVVPGVAPSVDSGFAYRDGRTDDARLVLRVLREACESGGLAMNYAEATDLLRDDSGRVVGVEARDVLTGCHGRLRAPVVVNATGPWADALRRRVGREPRMRRIRGSHLVFPRAALPVDRAIISFHPDSGLPFYLIPWEGVTLVGSTHVEEGAPGTTSTRIAPEEVAYLFRGLADLFPFSLPKPEQVLSTFSGVRPIVQRGSAEAGTASRDHSIWYEDGLMTVAGGKLTTFPTVSREVLSRLSEHIPAVRPPRTEPRPLGEPGKLPATSRIPHADARRIQEAYGDEALAGISEGGEADRRPIDGLPMRTGEVKWVLRREGVHHLADLMLRRFRIGLTAPRGGAAYLPLLRPIVQESLGWSSDRWTDEVREYRRGWKAEHGPPTATECSAVFPSGVG